MNTRLSRILSRLCSAAMVAILLTLSVALPSVSAQAPVGPSEVWVDGDWTDQSDVDAYDDSLTWDVDAFDTIQEGVDAVDGGTVYVLPAGDVYAGYRTTKDDVRVIGKTIAGDTPVVAFVPTMPEPGTPGASMLVGLSGTSNAVVENLRFDMTGMPNSSAAVVCQNCHSTSLKDLDVDGAGGKVYGIDILKEIGNATVTIEDCNILGCAIGIHVDGDTVAIIGCAVQGGGDDSFDSIGIWADEDSLVTVSGTELCDHWADFESGDAPGSYVGVWGIGVLADSYSDVTVSGCCDIHDNLCGVDVESDAALTANGNNIYDNTYYAVWHDHPTEGTEPTRTCVEWTNLDCESNWWGDADGPSLSVQRSAEPKPNSLSEGVDYTPWLDGPCPDGAPVGVNANLKGVARSGEPGLKVKFTDLSTPTPGCEIIEWLWDFGDGSTSTQQNPSHTYIRPGTYTVTLTAWDSCDCSDTIAMKAYVTISSANEEAAEPAKLGVSYLNIDPAQVLPNQEVVISANICNSGEERGSKTVSLMVNGSAVQSQSVAVSGGACQQVIFKSSRAVPGTYQVAIDGMTGQFSVLAPRTVQASVASSQNTGLGTAGIIAIVAVVVVLIAGLVMVFKED